MDRMEGFKEGFEEKFGGKGWMECGRIGGGVGIGVEKALNLKDLLENSVQMG